MFKGTISRLFQRAGLDPACGQFSSTGGPINDRAHGPHLDDRHSGVTEVGGVPVSRFQSPVLRNGGMSGIEPVNPNGVSAMSHSNGFASRGPVEVESALESWHRGMKAPGVGVVDPLASLSNLRDERK